MLMPLRRDTLPPNLYGCTMAMLGSPGAVSLVLNEGLPIVPVGIIGADKVLPSGASWPRFAKITVRYGEPIMPEEVAALGGDRRQRLRDATRWIMRRIAELTEQTAREDVLDRVQQEQTV